MSAVAPVTPAHQTPVRRRNGELQACEPCRKRKLRCDHGYPVCGRCIKRKGVDKCVYHPAPLTKKPKTAHGTPQLQNAESSPLLSTPPLTVAKTPSLRHASLAHVASESSIGTVHSNSAQTPTNAVNHLPAHQSRTGYVGNSSYSAVVAEIHASLGDPSQEDSSVHFTEPISDDKARRGAEVLVALRNIKLATQLVDRQLELVQGFIIYSPVYRVWLDGLNFFFGISGYDMSLDTDVVDLSRLVWKSTYRPLNSRVSAATTAGEWALEATGDNLRWETIGLIFSSAALMGGLLKGWDPIFAGKDRAEFLRTAYTVVETCLQLSKECGQPNELLLALMYEHNYNMRKVKGEMAFETWRATSECCDYAIALGLHQEKKPDSRTPFFLCELRKRLFSDIYSYDKFQSTHLGRPPRLTYRHSALQLPLDLSDNDICSTGARLSDALAQLDDKGWGTHGKRYRISWRRCWQLLLPVREDILELITQSCHIDLDKRIPEIRARINDPKDTFPTWFPKDPVEVEQQVRGLTSWTQSIDSTDWRPLDTDMYFSVQVAMAHTEFLLERAIYNRTKTDPTAMLLTAKDLLDAILRVYSLRDYLQEFASDTVVWLVFYGIPCAGVLAVETLKQDQSAERAPRVLPRSDIIQSLAVLISALETMRPDDGGNYVSCQHGLIALKRILEKILSPKSAIAEVDEQALLTKFPPDFATHTDADFLQWLGNVEWDGDHWFEHDAV